jgi:hypothetical protein
LWWWWWWWWWCWLRWLHLALVWNLNFKWSVLELQCTWLFGPSVQTLYCQNLTPLSICFYFKRTIATYRKEKITNLWYCAVGWNTKAFYVASVLFLFLFLWVCKKKGGRARLKTFLLLHPHKKESFTGSVGWQRFQALTIKKCNFISGIQCYLLLITKPNQNDWGTKRILRRLVGGLKGVKTEHFLPPSHGYFVCNT